MPLLSDAKKCYVGNTPITRIMSGTGFQVWPKGPPPKFVNVKLWCQRFEEGSPEQNNCTLNQDCKNPYLTWNAYPRPTNCARGMSYQVEMRNLDIPGSVFAVQGVFGTPGWRSYLPDSMPNSMCIKASTQETLQAKKSREYRLVYDDGINPPEYSESVYFQGNDTEIISLYLPIEYQENECNNRP